MDGEPARVHSVFVREIQSHTLITGWVERPVDPELARALAGLVAQTSAAIQTATMLADLRRSATHDPLTGLANRRRLEEELATLAGVDNDRLAIGFIDVDDFKTINDEHGHQVGDQVLIAGARRIEAVSGAGSIAARYRGDEFVVLMPDVGAGEARGIADAILGAFTDPVALGTSVVGVGLSIGVASSRTPISVPTLVEAADVALY